VTRAEYLEFVQEALAFPTSVDAMTPAPSGDVQMLRDTPEVCSALRKAHDDYCHAVAAVLGLKHEKGEL
jgi:hypothetical protein